MVNDEDHPLWSGRVIWNTLDTYSTVDTIWEIMGFIQDFYQWGITTTGTGIVCFLSLSMLLTIRSVFVSREPIVQYKSQQILLKLF